MTDEHAGQSIYENGRFRLRTESDYAIIDELGEFPDIMINHVESDDGSESQYADRSGVLHLLNQLADTNPNEQRHYYLKYLLNKRHDDNEGLRNKIGRLEKENKVLRRDKLELDVILAFNDEYSLKGMWNENLGIHDITKGDGVYLTPTHVVDRLNGLSKLNKHLIEVNEKLEKELADKDVQLDFLKAENEHMREVLNENKELNEQVKIKEKIIQAFEDHMEILKEKGGSR